MHGLTASDFPAGVTVACALFLAVAVAFALVVAVDVVRRPQSMTVMAIVWPLTMLFGSVVWFAFYRWHGRGARRGGAREHEHGSGRGRFVGTAIDTSHCGAGCALGDLVGEFGLVAFPAVGTLVGLGSLYRDPVVAGWIIDFVIAYAVGIAFQYFAIAPMRGLGVRAGLVAALQADTLSITAWQVGMYGLMAVFQFGVFPAVFGGRASPLSPEFWVAMQLAMVAGFVCAFPVNAWLVRRGIKEPM